MSIGYPHPLYVLAFDHRGSMMDRFGWTGATATAEQTTTLGRAKEVIYSGLLRAVELGVPRAAAGVLVDQQFGSSIPALARADNLTLAVCAEASGQTVFDFADVDWQTKLVDINPAMVKVLVRYNPDDDHDARLMQRDRLRTLSLFLQARGMKFLVEIIVKPLPEQLQVVNGDTDVFDEKVRPTLVARSIREFQASGVEADLWKVEGMRSHSGYEEIADAARSGGRDAVSCLVLGAGAPQDVVIEWLQAATTSPTFVGFAVGRSIWWDEIGSWAAGTMARTEAVESIAAKYLAMVEVFRAPVPR